MVEFRHQLICNFRSQLSKSGIDQNDEMRIESRSFEDMLKRRRRSNFNDYRNRYLQLFGKGSQGGK